MTGKIKNENETSSYFGSCCSTAGGISRRDACEHLETNRSRGGAAAAARPHRCEAQGSSTAGGFILPNHYVDVIHIFPFKEEHFIQISQNEPLPQKIAGDALVRRTILRNVRVLAIGQKDQLINGERVITGSNATLEVTPEQAETILIAQRTGTLTLALRSISDANTADGKNKHLAGDL